MGRALDRRRAFEVLFARTFLGCDYFLDVSLYTGHLVRGVEENLEKIDGLIKSNIENWSFDRISRVAKCALRIGVYEMISGDVPIPVSINEAVEISKIYAGEDDANFVQAVLSSIFRSLRETQNE